MTLTTRQAQKMASLRKLTATQVNREFGCYVGQVIGPSTDRDHHMPIVAAMLTEYPELQDSHYYNKLNEAGRVPVEAAIAVKSPQLPELPKEQQRIGRLPHCDTDKVRGTEVDTVDHDAPASVSVAKKLVQLYHSAMRRGIEFDLTHEDVAALLDADNCFYTDVPFTSTGLHSRTVERLDNLKGYVTGNVVAVTYQANQLKSFLLEDPKSELRMTPEMVLKMLFRIKHSD